MKKALNSEVFRTVGFITGLFVKVALAVTALLAILWFSAAAGIPM